MCALGEIVKWVVTTCASRSYLAVADDRVRGDVRRIHRFSKSANLVPCFVRSRAMLSQQTAKFSAGAPGNRDGRPMTRSRCVAPKSPASGAVRQKTGRGVSLVLASTRGGRVVLHLVTLLRSRRNPRWRLRGMLREMVGRRESSRMTSAERSSRVARADGRKGE